MNGLVYWTAYVIGMIAALPLYPILERMFFDLFVWLGLIY